MAQSNPRYLFSLHSRYEKTPSGLLARSGGKKPVTVTKGDSHRFIIALLFCVFLIASSAFATPGIQVDTKLSKKEIVSGARTELTLLIEWKVSPDIPLEILSVTAPSNDLLKLTDSKESSSSRLTEDGVFAQKKVQYIYEALKPGRHSLSPAVIEYQEGESDQAKQTAKSTETTVSVITPLLFILRRVLIIGVPAAAGISLSIWGAYLFRRSRLNVTYNANKKAIEEASLDLIKDTLARIHSYRTDSLYGDVKKYYAKMKRNVLLYVEKKYGLSLYGSTVDEIESLTRDRGVPEELRRLCMDWSRAAANVSYAGYRPNQDEEAKIVRETERYFKSLLKVTVTSGDCHRNIGR